MVVILSASALPDHPFNLLTRLSAGTTPVGQGIVPGVAYIIILGLGFVTHLYMEIAGRSNHAGKKENAEDYCRYPNTRGSSITL